MKNQKQENSFIDLLGKSVIKVESLDGNNHYYPPFSLRNFKNKYSNLEGNSLILFNGEEPLKSRKNKVTYKCSCGNIKTIFLSKFLIKTVLRCGKCMETEEKRKKHSETLRDRNRVRKIKIIKKYDLNTHITDSIESFKNEPESLIEKYYKINITENEFEKLRNKIISINGKPVISDEMVFLPPLTVTNQAKYSQYILFNNEKHLLENVAFKCEACNDIFNTTRRIKTKISKNRILCQACNFNTEIFKIIKYVTKFNDEITYQSKLELDFIKKCEISNIRILNGHKIPYMFDNKENSKYYIDFFLPDFNSLVELKGNHIWHRTQLQSGLWLAKQNAAEEYAKENNLTYNILFQEDIDNFFNLLRYSLDCNENYRS